jgi:hypothetical protein
MAGGNGLDPTPPGAPHPGLATQEGVGACRSPDRA